LETKQEAATPEPQEEKRQLSPEEMRQKYAAMQQNEWDNIANGERFKSAVRKGFVDSDRKLTARGRINLGLNPKADAEIVTEAQLRTLVPLEGDNMRYATTIGDRKVNPRMAENKLGFFSWPKPRGRRKPRPTPHQQSIKSTTLGIFRKMLDSHTNVLAAEAKEQGQPFNGVPVDDINKLGAKASKLAMGVVKERGKAARRKARRTQELSRRINRGLTPGNVNKRAYIG
jgi:hypothetical protein